MGCAGQIVQPNSNRLNSTGIDPYAANPTPDQYFNLAAFSNPVAGTVGNVQRNGLIGPATWDADFSVFKNIHLTERQTVQFRMEAFNVFNHPAWNSPIMTWGTTTQAPSKLFGQIRDQGSTLGTAYAMRQIQFALKYIF